MNILFLVPYPHDTAPSQRFRFEQYLDQLREQGYSYEIAPFWDVPSWNLLYSSKNRPKKVIGLLKGYWRRVNLLNKLSRFDFVFIHREATPLGPPWMEWIIKHVLQLPIIYDFDDAIWLHTIYGNNTFQQLFRYPRKVGQICSWSYKISCGNTYLAEYAIQHNPMVQTIPTTIDTENYHKPAHHHKNSLIIGWTGSHSTLPYLEEIVPILNSLRKRFDFVFKVICNKPPQFEIPGMIYMKWCSDHEIAELNTFDIGIMPLPDSDWTRGKCGFKILQYMALEKAAVASAVGVNTEIIQHGHNGLLCHSQSDWSSNLELLLTDKNLRNKLGRNGRATVAQHYSKSAIAASFVDLFN